MTMSLGTTYHLRTHPHKQRANVDIKTGEIKDASLHDLRETLCDITQSRSEFSKLHICNKKTITSEKGFVFKRSGETGKAYVSNVMRCGLNICPTCQAKKLAAKHVEIAETVAKAIEEGLQAVMVTLTIGHTVNQSLESIAKKLDRSYSLLIRRRSYKRLLLGSVGSIKSVEVRYGVNGWHYHVHLVLLISPIEDLRKFEEDLSELWADCVFKAGGWSGKQALAVTSSRDAETISNYITKGSKWTIGTELTGNDVKAGESLSPNDLLAKYHLTKEWKYAQLYLEYALAIKGKPLIRYSSNLRLILKLNEEKTDTQLLYEERQEDEVLYVCNKDETKLINRHRLLPLLLRLATENGTQAVALTLLAYLKIEKSISRGRVIQI